MTDDVKDQNVKIVLAGGEPLEYLVRTGEILDAQRKAFSQTHVSGGDTTHSVVGNSIITTTTPVSSSTSHWTEDTIFYKCGGIEYSVEFRNNTVPIRPGNSVSFIFVGRPGDDSYYLTGLYNHSTRREGTLCDRQPIKAPGMIFVLLAICVAFFLSYKLGYSLMDGPPSTKIATTSFGYLMGAIGAVVGGFIADFVRKFVFKGRLEGDVALIIKSLRSGSNILELHEYPSAQKQSTASPLGGLAIAMAIIAVIPVGGYLWNKYNYSWGRQKDVPMHVQQLNLPQPQLKPQAQPQKQQQQQPIQKSLQDGQKKITWSTNAKSFRGKTRALFLRCCTV